MPSVLWRLPSPHPHHAALVGIGGGTRALLAEPFDLPIARIARIASFAEAGSNTHLGKSIKSKALYSWCSRLPCNRASEIVLLTTPRDVNDTSTTLSSMRRPVSACPYLMSLMFSFCQHHLVLLFLTWAHCESKSPCIGSPSKSPNTS